MYYKKYKRKYKKHSKYSNYFNVITLIFLGIGLYNLTKSSFYIAIFIILPIVFIILNFIIKNLINIKRQKKYLDSGINIVDNLDGVEFEEYLLAHFVKLGYKGTLTPKTNDYGADLILKKMVKR